MRPNFMRDWMYRIVRILGVWLPLLLLLLCGIVGIWTPNEQGWPQWGVDSFRWIKENSPLLVPVLPVVVAISTKVGQAIGEPWFWRVINAILDDFQRDVFAGLPDERTDDHRVTLYKWTRCCVWPGNRWHWWWPWGRGNHPWSGWLKPIVRSGMYKRGRTIFLANKGQRELAEGVVGSAYFSQSGNLEKVDLPDIQQWRSGDNDGNLAEYAKQTFVSLQWLKCRLKNNAPVARSFQAIRVEVKKATWGVVMIDSRASKLPNPQKTVHEFQFLHKTLQTLLGRA